MRIDKLREFIKENNTSVIKNYPTMCEILEIPQSSGVGRKTQLEKMCLYMKYHKEKQKFIIEEIYDDEIAWKNVADLNMNKALNSYFGTSEYAKDLLPIILYLLSVNGNEVLVDRMELAVICGFLNCEIERKSSVENYNVYREALQEEYGNKLYFRSEMNEFNYIAWLGELKYDAYRKIASALNVLKKIGLINYETVYVGVMKSYENNFSIYPHNAFDEGKIQLTKEDIEKYKECKNNAINNKEVLDAYNEKARKKKDMLTEKDLIYRPDVKKIYYQKLNKETYDKLKFSMVRDLIYIKLNPDVKIDSTYISEIGTWESYLECQKHINTLFVNGFKNRIDNYAKKKLEELMIEKIGFIAFNGIPHIDDEGEVVFDKVDLEKLSYGDIIKIIYSKRIEREDKIGHNTKGQDKEKQKYYNKAELLDTLVSLGIELEVLNLDEFEKDCFESERSSGYTNVFKV